MESRKSGAIIFCECSSIRGMPKIAKTNSMFLRTLWLTFVLVMSIVLFVCVSLLLGSYLQYDVIVHTKTESINSHFPAITVCLHQPFSSRAFELWRNGSVMSPKKYNEILRQKATKVLESYSNENFSSVDDHAFNIIANSFYYDMLEIYYQNIEYKHAILLGHDASIIRKCVIKGVHGNINFRDPCEISDYGFKVSRFSHQKHLNCYTVEPDSESSHKLTDFLGLVVDIGPKPDYMNFQQGFLNDVFDQATGLRIVIHESYHYPNIEVFGMNIEAGKMTELTYTPTEWTHLNTATKPCEERSDGRNFKDMEREYHYSEKQCQFQKKQDIVIEKCKCLIGLQGWPRPIPTKEYPYCGSFSDTFNRTFKDLLESLKCIQSLDVLSDTAEQVVDNMCKPLCKYTLYETRPSVTHWGATDWQIYWTGKYVNHIEQLSDLKAERDEAIKQNSLKLSEKEIDRTFSPKFLKIKNELLRYLKKTNLTTFENDKEDSSANDLVGSNNFAYVVLKRKDKISVKKEEKLVISWNVLASQVGGLCSLTIGLTCAFAVEIIEFFYTYMKTRTAPSVNRNGRNPDNHKLASQQDDLCIPLADSAANNQLNAPVKLPQNSAFDDSLYNNTHAVSL